MLNREVKIFVCGSMHEGMVHYNKIANYVVDKTPATTKGQTYRLPVGYHVLVSSEEASTDIPGLLLSVKAPSVLWAILDEFHGVRPMDPTKGLHLKKSISVQTEYGEVEQAICYSYNPKKITKKCLLIEGGTWLEDFETNCPVTSDITPRQSQYILKLGASKGRDIVPIDLVLYRELMNLDIIVDKGRRLALTPLGKEVYRYLS